MTYRLHMISPSTGTITEGRKTVGWVKKDGETWVATMNAFKATGSTSAAAFHELFRQRRETFAKQAGFADYAAQLAAHNAEVRSTVAKLNSDLAAVGLPPAFRVRNRRVRV